MCVVGSDVFGVVWVLCVEYGYCFGLWVVGVLC